MSHNAVIFGEYAENYAQSRPQYPAALWQWLADQCEAHAYAWDAGCGNGQAALALAQHFSKVTASDVSEAQIQAATPHPRISYHVASSEAMMFAPQSLDLVCVAQALHWFDLEKFWPLAKAALKPPGVFVALAYGLFEVNTEIDALTKQYFYDVVEPFQAAGNRMIANGYRDITFPFRENIGSPPFAIECDWSLHQLIGYCATWSAVARMRKEAAVDPIHTYQSALSKIWGDESLIRRVRMPLLIKAGRL